MSAERLDSVRIQPMIEVLRCCGARSAAEEEWATYAGEENEPHDDVRSEAFAWQY